MAKKKVQHSQNKFFGMFILSVPFLTGALIIALSITSYCQYIRNERSRTLDYFNDISALAGDYIYNEIGSLAAKVTEVGYTVSQTDLSKDKLEDYLGQITTYTDLGIPLVFDENGGLLYGNQEYASVFSSWVSSAKTEGSTLVTNVIQCSDGLQRFALVAPINTPGKPAIKVMIVYPVSVLEETVNDSIFDNNGELCIIRSDGSFVFRLSGQENWKIPEKVLPVLLSGNQKKLEEFSFEPGSEKYIVYGKPIGINDWTLICAAPESVMVKRASNNTNIIIRFIAVSALLFAVLFCYGYFGLRIRKKRLELNREKFRIAVRQSARAVFEYDRSTDSFSFISECDNITLPFGNKQISLPLLLDFIYPSDREDSVGAIKVFNRSGYSAATVRISNLCGNNSYRWYYITAKRLALRGAGSELTIGSIEDIDEREKERLSLRQKATTDYLTGLYNRAETERIINERLAALNENESSTFALLDLDDFKEVNDSYGHDFGDKTLVFFSEKLKSTFRLGDVLGRLGGDEFVVYMAFTTDEDIVQRRINELSESFSSRRWDDQELPELSCSVGYVTATKGDTFESVYKRADVALYRAKEQGKSRACYGME